MDLYEFCDKMRKRINDYKEYYARQREADPDNWPEHRQEEDWWEDFEAFIGSAPDA